MSTIRRLGMRPIVDMVAGTMQIVCANGALGVPNERDLSEGSEQQNAAANEANKEQRMREVVEMVAGGDAERVSIESHRESFWMTTIMWHVSLAANGQLLRILAPM
ncbi:hypothetical protein GGX14DRAFT_384124 [Mycena pura]|uniref:Uncharacterized protein n=1 Tax=Mycena pura TaxID=153505 RepID=A0AAD6YV09_9AGAR|nr:hypothetical protein GGX14DRAFT_384124 [Mycena pura]